MTLDNSTYIFEKARPKLMGIAYRFLGSISDAEDIVQEVYIKWSKAENHLIENTDAWLKKVCARTCLDTIKSVERNRVDYVGTWLPEPLLTDTAALGDSLAHMDHADSLTTAFLLALERLSPKERAAFLLHHVFDSPYSDVADALGIEESACRKLVSRAKQNVKKQHKRTIVPADKADSFLNSFKLAIENGDQSQLEALLANDVVIRADGGGKVPTIREDIIGIAAVTKFLSLKLKRFWEGLTWLETRVNGNPGLVIKDKETTHAVLSLTFDTDGAITEIFIVRNPDKIRFLKSLAIN